MFLADNLHNHMIQDGLNTPRPFKEIVELGLQAAVARVATRGAVAERLAQQRHPRRRQPVAAARLALTADNTGHHLHFTVLQSAHLPHHFTLLFSPLTNDLGAPTLFCELHVICIVRREEFLIFHSKSSQTGSVASEERGRHPTLVLRRCQ